MTFEEHRQLAIYEVFLKRLEYVHCIWPVKYLLIKLFGAVGINSEKFSLFKMETGGPVPVYDYFRPLNYN
jgi:hypothetical protein